MSSGYSTAQLEAMRAAQLKKELQDNIRVVQNKIREDVPNITKASQAGNVVQTVFIEDDISGGVRLSLVVDALSIEAPELTQSEIMESERAKKEREELDFSSLLSANSGRAPSRAELELDALIKSIDERPVITEKDAEDRKSLLAQVSMIMADEAADTQYKADFIGMRVRNYLMGARKLTRDDEERIEADFYEYCALCALLGMNPVEKIPYRVEKEIKRMTAVLEKRMQNEYIMDVLDEIMEDLGCHVKEEAVMGDGTGQLYSVDGSPLCDVFVAPDRSGIMFEPVAESRGSSLDQRRRTESDAQRICSLYDEIERRAAEKGVILTRVFRDPANIEEIYVQSDISEHKGKRKQKRRTGKLLAIE